MCGRRKCQRSRHKSAPAAAAIATTESASNTSKYFIASCR